MSFRQSKSKFFGNPLAIPPQPPLVVGQIKTRNGYAISEVKTLKGIAITNIKTINGVSLI